MSDIEDKLREILTKEYGLNMSIDEYRAIKEAARRAAGVEDE